jgi:hypothetical protein
MFFLLIYIEMLLTLVQVVIALVLVAVLFVVAFYVYNREYIQAIQTATEPRKRVDIFKGIKDLKANHNETYETQDATNPTFKDIRLSVNQKGGAEFSYNFWIYKDQSQLTNSIPTDALAPLTDAGLRMDDIVLLLKGYKQTYTYKNLCGKEKTDLLVKCPAIKLQQKGKILAVELNTLGGPDGVHESSRGTCQDVSQDWKERNAHLVALDGLDGANFDKKWFMVSVVVQDTTPYDPLPFRNRVRVAIYINGVLELDRYVEGRLNSMGDDATVVRQNRGPFYIAPSVPIQRFTGMDANTGTPNYATPATFGFPESIPIKALYLADVSYFNYVLPEEEIKALYAARFTTTVAPNITDTQIARDTIADMKDSLSYVSGEKQLQEF